MFSALEVLVIICFINIVVLHDADVIVVGIAAYTHFKLQEQRVERQQDRAEMEMVACNGPRSTSIDSAAESSSLVSSVQE